MVDTRKDIKTFKSTSPKISPSTKGKVFPKKTIQKDRMSHKSSSVKSKTLHTKKTRTKSRIYTAKTTRRSKIARAIWMIGFPLTAGGVIGAISYVNPALIPPALNILEPDFNLTAGVPDLIDPLSVGVLNGVIYGAGALILGVIISSIFRR